LTGKKNLNYLVNLMEGVEAKAVNSADFIKAIRANLEKRLGC